MLFVYRSDSPVYSDGMKKKLILLVLMGWLAMPASILLAQKKPAERIVAPPPLPGERYYGAYALGLVLTGLVCIGAFKTGRRSHLD